MRVRKNYVLGGNATQFLISMCLPPYLLPKYMIGGSEVKSKVGPDWVRKVAKRTLFIVCGCSLT
jgi:hypothetical protein